ncbi:EAL domain-containing protein [Duganella sp. BJB1802]|uniref:bifunctional diguanylate cyclase/phosphodiesterase n=1 Tax=Duganella sp. BJB1802 TaxID=2744575 RepID=UPI001593E32B|nr:EAL domain-containing protein [Duganella sp. BJB1802]NVD71850.1 EAL domain-containing protein [Duganella sp. BJB1802]
MHRIHTVRNILLFIVAALVLPGFLIGLVWSLQAFDASRARSDTQTLQTARDLLLDMDSEFHALGAVAGTLTTSPALLNADLAAFQQQAEAARRYSKATNFVLTDIHGQQLVNTLKPFGTPLPRHGNPALIARVAASGRMEVSNLYVGAVSGAGVMSICIPVRIRGKLAYFLDVGVAASEFAPLLASRKLPADWIVALIDGDGTIVARTRSPGQYVGKKAQADLRQLIPATQQGHLRTTTLEGIPVYTTYVRSPANGWAVAIGIPSASVDSELWHSLAFDLGASGLLLLVGIVLAALASAHIRRAMAQLVEMSAALGSGAELPPHRIKLREAHQVAATLTETAVRLRRSEAARQEAQARITLSNIELEQRVRDRTDALQQSRHMMASILEHMPAAIFVKRADDLSYEMVNQAAEQLYGKPRDAFIGRSDLELFPEAEAQARTASDRQVIASRQILDLAAEAVLAPDGQTRYLHTKKMVLLDGAGRPSHLLGISLDVTDSLLAAEQLHIAAVAFDSQEPMMITDAQSTILRINSAFTASTGYTQEEILGRTPRVLKSGRHDQAFYAAMWDSIIHRGSWQGECWDRRKNGEIYPTWTIISAIRDPQGAIRHYVCTQSDISARKQAEEEIRQLAFYDPLTRLPNRRLLVDRLRHAIDSSARTGLIGALMFIDLDNFKMLNDTLGHDQGDVLLRQVAQRLPACVRSVDTVARLGGDEFVIMLEGLSADVAEAARKAQAIGDAVLAALNQPYQLADRPYHCTPSIGVTLISDHQLTMDDVLRHADLAMYQAKGAGRNTLRFFEPRMQQAANLRAEIEHDLQHALEHGEFELYYQAQVDAAGQLIGAEALLRWHHPRNGLVLPDQFIELAESTGIILPLGQWVLQSACAQLALWAADPALGALTLAVNVSPRQFRQPAFVAQVQKAVADAGANPHRLKLELTENLMLDDFSSVADKMRILKSIGIGFALDDFGIGYSSLSYLKRLPLDQLKIDRTFARDVLTDPNDAAIARIIVVLGHTLGLTIVAEGVETNDQHAFLAATNCNAFQGFLFSQPLPEREFRSLAARAFASGAG